MAIKIDKTGEEKYNNFGSKMIITRYGMNRDIDVYFPEYNWTAKNKHYKAFKTGQILCPYEPRDYGVGYLGEGEYKKSIKGKHTPQYITYHNMLMRCYDSEYQIKQPTYKECEVEKWFLNFQNFGKWYDENYYEVPGERMHLDKDILIKDNKLYSRETCIFVPQRINELFINKKGFIYHKSSGKFEPRVGKSSDYLGVYSSKHEAFQVYKFHKEKMIKEVADEYYSKGLIPKRLYDGMYRWEV